MHIACLPDTIGQLTALQELVLHTAEPWPAALPALPAAVGRLGRLRRLQMTAAGSSSAALLGGPEGEAAFPPVPGSVGLLTGLQELVWGNLHLVSRVGAE
jgi:hypothetical protein